MATQRVLHPHVPHPHLPHPHVPHPHLEIDEHPWRAVPVTLAVIVLLATLLMIASFAISKAIVGRAY